MNTVPYLSLRHQKFYFRRSVPKNLRGFFSQREVIRSLITSDPREAQKAAMGIRRLISATLIVGLGLIFIKLTQSSNYEVVQAIEKIQETEFADREAVDFILEKFEEGDATASDFIVDYDNLTEFIEIRPNIVEKLEAFELPHLDASLARYYSSGSFGSQLDWAKSLELYLSGLEGCHNELGAIRWPLINGVDLIQFLI